MLKKKYKSFIINPFPYCLLIVVLHKMLEAVMVKIDQWFDQTFCQLNSFPWGWADYLKKKKWKTTFVLWGLFNLSLNCALNKNKCVSNIFSWSRPTLSWMNKENPASDFDLSETLDFFEPLRQGPGRGSDETGIHTILGQK